MKLSKADETATMVSLWRQCLLVAIATVVCAGGATPARGQTRISGEDAGKQDEVETDRDAFTFATTTAGAGRAILEGSYSFIDNRLGPEAHSFPELLVRRGIGERLELRFGYNSEAGGPGTVSGTEVGGEDIEAEEEGRVLYGLKAETSEQSGWTPQSALIVQGYTPVYGPSTASTVVVGEAWGWTFSNGWAWNTALRYGTGFDVLDAFDQWAPSTVLKIPVGERWNVHAEYFGIFSSGKAVPINVQYASFGGHVLLTKDLELGIRYGWGLNDTTPNFFANAGVGYRY